MKKTVFHKIRRLFRFTLLVCLSLGVLSAKAQTARVTLKVQNASLGQVMDEIKNRPDIFSSIRMSRISITTK